MGILDDLLGAGNTPWAQQQMAQMLGQTPSAASVPVAAPSVAPIPETPLGTQPPAAAPAPAQYPFQQDPGGADGGDFLAALLSGAGGPLGNLGKMMLANSQADKARQMDRLQKNATFQFFKKRGLDDDMAAMAVMNPEVGKSVLGTLFGPKKGPQLVEIPDQYGNPRKYAVDPNTGNLVDPSTLIQGAPQIAPGAAPAPVAPGMMVTPAPSAEPPAGLPGNPMGGPTSGIVPPASTQLGTQPDVEVGQPQVVSQPQAAIPPGMVAGPPYQGKPPEGTVQRQGPNGEFLYKRNPDGRLVPDFMSKTEYDAIGKSRGEQTAGKVIDQETGKKFAGALSLAEKIPEKFGTQAFERAIGPYQADEFGIERNSEGVEVATVKLPSFGQKFARATAELDAALDGGAKPTEVRDEIAMITKNLATVMKPFVRKSGEGPWTDKDQANLEQQVGNLARARTADEYRRRLANVKKVVEEVLLVKIPQVQQVQQPANPGDPPAPARAEDEVTWAESNELLSFILGTEGPLARMARQAREKKAGGE